MTSYEDKIFKAIDYIEKNLGNSINWGDISKYCGISHFHFHRIFSSYMEETPGDFIKRKRLEQAMGYLAYGCKANTISDIALECGYSSQANFSKAFKLYFGVTPGDVLRGEESQNSKIGKIKSKYGKDFNIKDLYPNLEQVKASKVHFREVLMNVKMKEMNERHIIYMKSERGYLKESILETWDKLIEKASYLPIEKENFEMFGIGHDNPQVTPEEKCHYDACILIEEGLELGEEFNRKSFPAGKYACFYFKGSESDLLQFYLNIYKNWFPKSGYEPGDFPLIENYLNVSKDSSEIELEVQFLVK